MTLAELISAADLMLQDAKRNAQDPDKVEVKAITDRGAIRVIKGQRVYDVRVNGPVLLVK